MNILLITRAYPFPAHSGDLLVTAELTSALAAEPDVDLTVFCGERGAAPIEDEPQAEWIFGGSKRFASVRSLVSASPLAAVRALSPGDLRAIAALVAERRYDMVIVNESAAGQAAKVVAGVRRARGDTVLVYLSHNVDSVIRLNIARNIANPIERIARLADAYRYQRLEAEIVRHADAVTAMSEEDVAYYENASGTATALLKPAYGGERLTSRTIDSRAPRVAVLVGTFHWAAKQINLRELVEAYKRACEAGEATFALRIAGRMPDALAREIAAIKPDITLVRGFRDLTDVLRDARIAFVLERLGGGFKLKILDYVFHRVPIMAYPAAMAGSSLTPGEAYLAVETAEEAMRLCESAIDDDARLNSLHEHAYAAASDAFSWSDRVQTLRDLADRVRGPARAAEPEIA
ncbi:MAG: glycosyltransferase [Caulobacterales bacterium]|nr:glycosyltransferase [Caulobacterales bacterium]